MPNWCECDLNIKGPAKDVAKFKKFAESEKSILDQNKFIKLPERFLPAKNVFYSNENDWRIKHWGTKWGICDPIIASETEHSGITTLQYTFVCAWSPCLPVILKMGKKFKSLQFELRYYEQGMAFQGEYLVIKSKVELDKSWSYKGHRGG